VNFAHTFLPPLIQFLALLFLVSNDFVMPLFPIHPGYTLNELPHPASALTLAAMLWEKLANGGILVIVEPGTPDGFNAIRSVREMLIECCPIIVDESADGYDQCHVIAPCTHNGR
jgi:hypothetical protein